MIRALPLASLSALLILLSGCGPAVPTLDVSDVAQRDLAIVGGLEASPSQTYATVALTDLTGVPFCTGTLIAPQVVVSAAHCLQDEGPEQMLVIVDAIDPAAAPQENRHAVVATLVHPEFGFGVFPSGDPEGLTNDRDLGVLLLTTPVTLVEPAPILPLNTVDNLLLEDTPLIISGYGLTQNNASPAPARLHIASSPFQRQSTSELLIGQPGSPDSCQGDSGGPAYLQTANGPVLVGATARGASTGGEECGNGGIYTLVSAFDDWIESVSCGLYEGSDQGAELPLPEQGGNDSGATYSGSASDADYGSCQGFCGNVYQSEFDTFCGCDPTCVDYQDCCSDYVSACTNESAPPLEVEPLDLATVCSAVAALPPLDPGTDATDLGNKPEMDGADDTADTLEDEAVDEVDEVEEHGSDEGALDDDGADELDEASEEDAEADGTESVADVRAREFAIYGYQARPESTEGGCSQTGPAASPLALLGLLLAWRRRAR